MFTIKKFFEALTPNFTQMTIVEATKTTYSEMAKVKEFYDVDSRLLKLIIKNNNPAVDKVLRSNVKNYRGNPLETIKSIAESRSTELNDALDYIDGNYGHVVFKEGLNLQNLNVARYVDSMTFFNEYSRRYMLVTMNKTINDPDIVTPVDQQDIDYVEDAVNIKAFGIVCGLLTKPFKETTGNLLAFKNIRYSNDTIDLIEKQNPKYVELSKGYLPIIGGLVIMLGKQRNMYLANRLDSLRLQQEKLQYQILLLNRKLDGTDSSEARDKIVEQIKYNSNRLNKIQAVIDELEEDAV